MTTHYLYGDFGPKTIEFSDRSQECACPAETHLSDSWEIAQIEWFVSEYDLCVEEVTGSHEGCVPRETALTQWRRAMEKVDASEYQMEILESVAQAMESDE